MLPEVMKYIDHVDPLSCWEDTCNDLDIPICEQLVRVCTTDLHDVVYLWLQMSFWILLE